MSMRRTPNPNRNHPEYCPYCAGTGLFPDTESEFAWSCWDCARVFSVMFHGQNDTQHTPRRTVSSAQALHNSLERRGHLTTLRSQT